VVLLGTCAIGSCGRPSLGEGYPQYQAPFFAPPHHGGRLLRCGAGAVPLLRGVRVQFQIGAARRLHCVRAAASSHGNGSRSFPSLPPSVPPSLRPSLPLRVCVCARARAVRLGRMQRDPHTRCGGCRAHTEIPIFAVTLYLGMIFYLPQHLGEAPGKGIVRKAWGIWNLLLSIFRRAARTLPLC
jgi:hypothetical protein